ncbi:MAG: DUF1549 domain-containing protein [Verrucomicrobia bacterium]|jgi:hypothetical protein|nr:DUF1549 domain-containing protein [Verrucomicrobiota bacterium]|tara:strand:+ start:4762 stop:6675 length:1914 start_codon:yes stop_codon:yes gene_type:complete
MKTVFITIALLATEFPVLGQARDEQKLGDDPAYLTKAAFQIDTHIASFYKRKKLPVPAVTNDATFMRRAFLVSIGRIPTAEEALAFLEIEDESKRSDLVSYLMNAKGYTSHMTNWAFDLLRLRDGRPGSQANNEPYRNWIRKAIDDNMPWDEFVTSLLNSSGSGWDPKTASVGYYTIDRGMPLDNLANTLRVFLGSRMECAQCHDDPFGETERMDFYHLAAFTNGQYEQNKKYMTKLWRETREGRKERGLEYRVAQLFWDKIYGMSLSGGGKGRIKLPSDYQYRDGSPGELIGAKTPFGKSVRMSDRKDDVDGRAELAEWVVTKTGEQFPGTIANRMWERIMGKGIYEPVDEYIESSETVYPALMSYLARLMHDLGYDLRAFQQVLLLTKTFQFATNPNPSTLVGGDDFHGRKIERLSAEQIWDSLITLSRGDPDKNQNRTADNRIYVGNKPVLVGKMDMVQLSKEVLALESESEVRNYFKTFMATMKNGGADLKGGESMSMGMMSVKKYGRDAPVRASELPSPAPREHFLYLFGASDREVVEGASLEPNVGQVLSMMNGYVQRQLVSNYGAHIYKSLEGASSESEKIRRLYVAILNRPPSNKEMGWMKEEVAAQGEEGYRNIVAALVMSSEFLFLQ